MASSTSFPAPGSRSKKPLGKMAGELKQTPNAATLAPMSVVLIFLLASGRPAWPKTQRREAERLTIEGQEEERGPALASVSRCFVVCEERKCASVEPSVLLAHRFSRQCQLIFLALKPWY